MSEEIVYANLKFQDSDKKENIQKSEECGGKVPSASHSQHKTVSILALLCFLLFVGLGVLGGMFYTTLETERTKLSKLQNTKEELQRNVSLQLMHNLNSSQKIGNLSTMLQKIATQLCRELYEEEREHKCKPCPKRSLWYKDNCYTQLDGFETWQRSEMLCSAQNASLLKIKSESELEFIMSLKLSSWLGLSPRCDHVSPERLYEDTLLYDEFDTSTLDLTKMYCGYLRGSYVYYTYCNEKKSVMCEKTASSVQVESVLNDIPEGSV